MMYTRINYACVADLDQVSCTMEFKMLFLDCYILTKSPCTPWCHMHLDGCIQGTQCQTQVRLDDNLDVQFRFNLFPVSEREGCGAKALWPSIALCCLPLHGTGQQTASGGEADAGNAQQDGVDT